MGGTDIFSEVGKFFKENDDTSAIIDMTNCEVLQILNIVTDGQSPFWRNLFDKNNFIDVNEFDYPLFEGLFDCLLNLSIFIGY